METPKPNAAMRKKLAVDWDTLNDEQKLIKRAARSRQGIKCDICGKIGYYRETCPSKCVSPPGTPDSMDSTPPSTPPAPIPEPVGIFWGDQLLANDESPKGKYDFKKKVDVNTVRPKAKIEERKLKESDANIGTFEFFAEADEGYSRSYPELTLHQVMRRLMRLLERQLTQNAEKLEAAFDTTLLHPPVEKDRDTFYPAELSEVKAYREYFLAKELKKDRRKTYKNQASLRPADDLDPLFRGGVVDDRFLYSTNPHAGASMHGKNTWKSVLSHSDDLASSDPLMAVKQRRIDKLFEEQSKWIAMQQRSMTYRNDRFEHLVNILKTEITAEHRREASSLKSSKHANKATQMAIWQERLEAVDAVMSCLNSYNFTSGLDEADFLVFCFERWRQTLQSQVTGRPMSESVNTSTLPTIKGGTKSGSTTAAPQGNSAVTGHNKMISSSSPYFSDQQAVEKAEKKTRKLRDKFLADGAAARAKSKEEEEQKQLAAEKKAQRRLSVSLASMRSGSPLTTRSGGGDGDEVSGATRSTRMSFVSNASSGNRDDVSGGGAPLLRMPSGSTIHSQTTNTTAQSRDTASDLRSLQYNPSSSSEARPTSLSSTTDGASQSLQAAMQHSQALIAAAETKRLKRRQMQTSRAKKTFTVVHKRHPRDIDAEEMNRAKRTFISADLAGNIRKGLDSDLACVAPTLIPVPGAFDGDGRHPMSSYVAENIVFKVKKNMILGNLGYTPQRMLPLYVRNTLIESYGTSPGGDQAYDTMSGDKRYSHYIGRPLNRFEPKEEVPNDGTQSLSSGYGQQAIVSRSKTASQSTLLSGNASQQIINTQHTKALTYGNTTSHPPRSNANNSKDGEKQQTNSATALTKDEKHAAREDRRQLAAEMKAVKGTAMSGSLLRMAFSDPMPSLSDLNFLDEF